MMLDLKGGYSSVSTEYSTIQYARARGNFFILSGR